MAVKTRTIWSCTECGHNQVKWAGQCPTCKQWNTLIEETEVTGNKPRFEAQQPSDNKPVRLNQVTTQKIPRVSTKLAECDRLLGGGLVPGSLTLVGGDPGIGKSTLLLQISNQMAEQGLTVLYVCGEESVQQTSLRAQRLGVSSDNLLLFSETNYSTIKAQIDAIKPQIVIVDSIQLVYKSDISSAPGSVAQVREVATEFMHVAKGRGISVFLIGHVTKSGEIAGPRLLEHLVDTVLYFEGDKQLNYRMIRVVKNRFGATDEIAVFQMGAKGLTEVANPSQIFLEERSKGLSGSVIIPTLEGTRPILIEVQALVTDTAFSTPSRRCAGIDQNRLALLLAVMEKRLRYPMYQSDVFVSVAGGIRALEPAVDLGVLLSVASSMKDRTVGGEWVAIGEVGLGGEVRSVPRVEARLKEAIHMGFTHAVVPEYNLDGLDRDLKQQINIRGIKRVEEAVDVVIT